MSYSKVVSPKLDQFRVLNVLGKGSFGEVSRAVDITTGEYVAIKKIETWSPEAPQDVVILRGLKHQHVVGLRDYFSTAAEGSVTQHQLIMELCVTDLHAAVGKNLVTSVAEIKRVFLQALRGMEFIHGKGIIHRDIKPSNILLNSKGEVKVGDLGLAVKDNEPRGYAGTASYTAPEVTFGCEAYSTAVDMWSMGLVLYFLVNRAALFHHSRVSKAQIKAELTSVFGGFSNEDFPGLQLQNLKIREWPP